MLILKSIPFAGIVFIFPTNLKTKQQGIDELFKIWNIISPKSEIVLKKKKKVNISS